MKKVFLGLLVLVMITVACNKNNDGPNLPSTEYALYNYSSGTAVNAGKFSFRQLPDSNASVTVTLDKSYLQEGASYNATISTGSDSGKAELTYAVIGTFTGANGSVTASPLRSLSTNMPIKYSDLLARKGYYVKVLSGANVQAKGEIK
jgi:hypothetical protein